MPTLDWIGKKAVAGHHHEVPFHLLREDAARSAGDPAAGNLLVQGDNLTALKALLPHYAGQVKCIYIDPPYNTGNEGWSYNDNVNSPEMKRWLGATVGKEAEDLSRHDKWLCMMYPRLVLLRELLAEDGSFWMSIDDNEVHHARVAADNVFSGKNFVTAVSWQKVYTVKNSARHFSEMHDHLLVYAKNKDIWERNLLGRTADQDDAYINPDNDPRGPWKATPMHARNPYSKGKYSITAPSGRTIDGPPSGRYWAVSKSKFEKMDADNQIWWGEDGSNAPAQKRFLSNVQDGVVPTTMWFHEEAGHNAEAKNELREVFPEAKELFITPKPTRLVQRILQIATDPQGGDLVLDSFAGTGTTGHAVLKQNAEDGGNRRFILVELEQEIAQSITAERLRRAVEGYPYEGTERTELFCQKIGVNELKKADELLAETDRLKKEHADEYDKIERSTVKKEGHLTLHGVKRIEGHKEGLSGGFRYFALGPVLTDAAGQIHPDVTFEELARHVHFSETGRPLPDGAFNGPPLVSAENGAAIYVLAGNPGGDGQAAAADVLTREVLDGLPPHDGPKVVYAAACRLSEQALQERGVTFRQLPYDVRVS